MLSRGICLANGSGDLEKANGFEYFRMTPSQALEMGSKINQPYMLLWTGATTDEDYLRLADDIASVWKKLVVKPEYILLSNEQNELSYKLAQNVRALIGKQVPVPILKGPFTCCVERAGRQKYKELTSFDGDTEVLNYYERPHWIWYNWFENQRRRFRLRRIVNKLKANGVSNIIISETHDGSTTRDGYENQGDYVYASKKGWDSICDFLSDIGVNIVCYYHAPFIGRAGNDVKN